MFMRCKRSLAMLCILLLLIPFTGQGQEMQRFSTSFFGAFDTVITIIGFAPNADAFEQITEKAKSRFDELNQLYDKYNDYPGVTNIRTLNKQAAQAPVKVEQDLFDLIKFSKEMYSSTDGLVNIAFGSVLELWHDSREAAEFNPEGAAPPEMDALNSANSHTNIDDVVLDEGALTVFFQDPDLRLDVGAVAKGYAVEVVAREVLQDAMPSYIINAGGNVRTGQAPLDGRAQWGVSIQDPDGFVMGDANSDIMEVLFLKDTSIVTSGDYQRFFTFEGKRYHHIISPITLMPPNYFRSVTVVTEDSALADWLSTTLFLMQQSEGETFLENWEGVEALWVMNDRTILMTEGLKPHARSEGATNPR